MDDDDVMDADTIAELTTMVMEADKDDVRMLHFDTVRELILAERDACAKIASAEIWDETTDGTMHRDDQAGYDAAAKAIGAAIRARHQPQRNS